MLNKDHFDDTITQLRACPLQRPESAGSDWQGIQHGRLLDELGRRARARRWTTGPVVAKLQRHGYDLTAGLTIHRGRAKTDSGVHPGLALTVSNAKRRQLRFYVGAWLDAPGCTVIFDTFLSTHRYTPTFRLDEEAEAALDRWDQATDHTRRRLTELGNRPVDLSRASELLLDAKEARLLADSRILKAVELFRNRREPTALGLVKAFGATAAANPPDDQLDQLLAFYRLVVAAAVAKKPADVA